MNEKRRDPGPVGVDSILHDLNRRQAAEYTRQRKKVGRNKPCPCGSGEKHKRCCWDGPMKPVVDPDFLVEWGLAHERCAACHSTRDLTTHHLVKRSRRRVDLDWNLLRLCFLCHGAAEGERVTVDGKRWPTLTLAHCLWMKREADPAEWRPDLLAEVNGRPLPETERAPDFYLELRRRGYVRWAT